MAKRKDRKLRAQSALTPPPALSDLYTPSGDHAPDSKKLSTRLLELMAPWRDSIPDEQLIDYAALGWNAAVDGEKVRDVYENVHFQKSKPPYTVRDPDALTLIRRMRGRKRRLFPEDERRIQDMKLTLTEDGDPFLIVAGGIPMPTKEMIRSLASRLADRVIDSMLDEDWEDWDEEGVVDEGEDV